MKKKVWFITGISSGLGKALSEEVIASGDFVIGTLRQAEQVEEFNKTYAGKAMAYLLNITDYSAMEKVLSEVDTVDVLVNNAGNGFVGAIEETSLEELRGVFETNFFAPFRLTQLVLPKMRKKGYGHIVQISSHGGVKAFAGFGAYNASKFALEGFSEAMADEIAPLGIKTTIVEPGPFRTKFAATSLVEAENVIDAYNETALAFRNKLKHVDGKQEGDPQKAAKAILDKVNSDSIALRMPLGKVPLVTIQMKLDSLQADLNSHRAIAEKVVFD